MARGRGGGIMARGRGGGIGVVNVALGVDASAWEKGLQDAANRLQTFASRVGKIGAAAGAAIGALGTVTAVAVRNTLTEIDKLTKMSRQLGVPVEHLSALKFAAEDSGVAIENLSSGMQTLATNMAKAASDAQSQVALAFDAIGVSVRDAAGNLRSSTEVMTEIADRFSKMQDGAAKTALALQLFGSSGSGMITMLNQGRSGLEALTQEARNLGLVIDRQTGEAAERFNGTLSRLTIVNQGMWLQITKELLPAFESLAERLLQVARDGETVKAWAETLTAAFRYVITVGERLIATIQTLKLAYDSFWDESGKETTITQYMDRLADGYRKIRESYDRNIASLTGENLARSLGVGELERLSRAAEQSAAPVVKSTAEIARANAAAAQSLSSYNRLMSEGQRIYESTRTETERYAMEVQKLRSLFDRGAISAETFQRALTQLRSENSGFSGMMQSLESSFEGAFVDAITGAKKLGDALKDLLSDVTKMFAQAAFRSVIGNMFGPTGFNFGGGLPGFQHGGQFTVGGSGGTDSQVVAFRATPGERVSVDRAGAPSGGTVLQPKVIVNNYADASVDSQAQDDGTLIMTVRAITRDELGSQSSQTVMAGAYGMRPRIRSR